MKKYFNLIGSNFPAKSWVVTYADVPPKGEFITDSRDMISASRWPILFFDQIPKRWLERDPGFPILLRAPVQLELPSWIHNPVLPDDTSLKGKYAFISPKHSSPKTVLFTIKKVPPESWEKLTAPYQGLKCYWIRSGLHHSPCPYPSEKEISLIELQYHKRLTVDLLIDPEFGNGDTYGPVHLFCLKNGAMFSPLGEEKFHNSSYFRSIFGASGEMCVIF